MPRWQGVPSGSAVNTVRPPLVPYDLQSPNDDRPVLLFDLNGTLTSHTARRKSVGTTKIRPGIHHLRRLTVCWPELAQHKPLQTVVHVKDIGTSSVLFTLNEDGAYQSKYRLGIYTSSSERTTRSVLPMLEMSAGRGEPLFKEPVLILYRAHTQHATHEHKAAGGKDWDTVKPLSRYFARVGRVLLVDDDAYKAVPGEGGNMIVVPCWEKDDPRDTVIEALANALLALAEDMPPGADMRPHTAKISQAASDILQGYKLP